MKTAYFTFGQCHEHIINGFVFDRDIVVRITAENPRDVMFQTFGKKWAMQYDTAPDMSYYPRGFKDITDISAEQRSELWEQYQHEMEMGYGFGHPSEWLSERPRNFAEFCTRKRIEMDTNKALKIITG